VASGAVGVGTQLGDLAGVAVTVREAAAARVAWFTDATEVLGRQTFVVHAAKAAAALGVGIADQLARTAVLFVSLKVLHRAPEHESKSNVRVRTPAEHGHHARPRSTHIHTRKHIHTESSMHVPPQQIWSPMQELPHVPQLS
jgi:hypothetical protein